MLSRRFPFQGTKILASIRFCYNERNELTKSGNLQKKNWDDRLAPRAGSPNSPLVQYWNERAALRKERRENRFPRNINSVPDLIRFFQSLKNLPSTLGELYFFLKRRRERAQLIEQKYLPRRVAILKSDLAAAHFIVLRGGSVKFLGQQEWIGCHEKKRMLPLAYIPGLFIECIKAEGTELYYEGLPNLARLKYLKYLSLKNLETMNDWCIDWISKEYYQTLKHLDISGCVNVTHRCLSCFYRFECLETLNVEGIPDTPEFKLACLTLLELMPDLDIQGIDLSIPKKIDGNELQQIASSGSQVQHIPNSGSQIQSSQAQSC